MLILLGFIGCTGLALAGGGLLVGVRIGRSIERDDVAQRRDGLAALATVHHLPRPARPAAARGWGRW